MRRIFVLEALMIGVIGALAGWVLGYVLSPRHSGTIEIKNPFIDATRLPLVYSPAALCARRRPWRWPPR